MNLTTPAASRPTSQVIGYTLDSMRRKLSLFFAILLFPLSAYANPIAIGIDLDSFPPQPAVLCSLLVEVLVVAALVWRFRLKMLLFLPIWYGINLLSFILLLQGFSHVAHLVFPSEVLGAPIAIAAEALVFIAEAAALYGLSRWSLLHRIHSKNIPWASALPVSVIGNFASIVAFHFWLNFSFAEPGSYEIAARADIQAIGAQLHVYTSMNGFYPTTEQSLDALVAKPNSSPIPEHWMQLFDERPKDPWQSPYVYRCPGIKNSNGYDLFSAGPDRKPDTTDDDWGN